MLVSDGSWEKIMGRENRKHETGLEGAQDVLGTFTLIRKGKRTLQSVLPGDNILNFQYI